MKKTSEQDRDTLNMELSLKKAASEMLVLSLLCEQPRSISEVLALMGERSGGVFQIAYPYALIYRMLDMRYLRDTGGHVAEDGRRRQFYEITESGRAYYQRLSKDFDRLIAGINAIRANA